MSNGDIAQDMGGFRLEVAKDNADKIKLTDQILKCWGAGDKDE